MASAALYTDNAPGSCTKKRAMLEAHGDADPTVPYLGGQGRGGWTPNVSDWVDWWGVRTCGAGKARKSTERKPGYELETYSCDEGGLDDVITHYHLDAPAAHCWPDAQGDNYDSLRTPEGCGNSRSLDFTAVVFEWFERWDLKNAPGAASYGWSGGAFGGGKDRYDL
jgi:poly(3-hydroxybutyrate) depolymerase